MTPEHCQDDIYHDWKKHRGDLAGFEKKTFFHIIHKMYHTSESDLKK